MALRTRVQSAVKGETFGLKGGLQRRNRAAGTNAYSVQLPVGQKQWAKQRTNAEAGWSKGAGPKPGETD